MALLGKAYRPTFFLFAGVVAVGIAVWWVW
ncbi:hypothetical protein ABIB95_005318 [Bradyrhizobium sp. LA2.1]